MNARLMPACSPVIEQLESRQMLAVTLADGVLTVTGSTRGDAIKVVAGRGNNTAITVRVNRGQIRRFDSADIDALIVKGGAGNDVINATGVVQNLLVMGGSGNDRILGSGGGDLLMGGAGNDDIAGRNGHDQIYGDAGIDELAGGKGNDTLGGDDEDTLWARGDTRPADIGVDGDDLDGGDGNDWLLSGTESDEHDDLSGDDNLRGGPGTDVIDIRGRNEAGLQVGAGDTIVDDTENNIIPVRDVAGVEQGAEDLTQHRHAFIKISILGEDIFIPGHVGQFLEQPVVHTHDDLATPDVRGTELHFHNTATSGGAARVFRLEDFFRNWGISFSSQNIGRHRVDANHELIVEVNPQGSLGGNTFSRTQDYEKYVIQTPNNDLDSTHFDQIRVIYREIPA